jgi:hypothetical protein
MTTIRARDLTIDVGGEAITIDLAGRRIGKIEVAGNTVRIEAAGNEHSPLAAAPGPEDGTHSGLLPVTHLGVWVTHLGLVVFAKDEPRHA